MCGIAGIIGIFQKDPELILTVLQQRGPEGSGYFKDQAAQLFHTRLAIQDLSEAGAQPMQSSDGRYTLVFNGEIYNHTALRRKINGVTFRSHSDTETLLYLLIQFGTDILEELNGIFAFALYDKQAQTLLLARDRFGVKPLYYRDNLPHTFCFASTLNALRILDSSPTRIRAESIAECLMLQYNLTETTGFKDVKRLGPGDAIIVDITGQKSRRFKWAKPLYNGHYDERHEKEWIGLLEQSLLESVERQLLSDKPVSFFLSGGIDSSLLVAMAARLHPELRLQAYCVETGPGFGKEGFSYDYAYAAAFAKSINCTLHGVEARPDLIERLDTTIATLEEMQADPASFFTGTIAQKAKESGHDVLIGGTGADDIFSGYRRHQALRYYTLLDKVPEGLRKTGLRLLHLLPATKFRRAQKLLELSLSDAAERNNASFHWNRFEEITPLLSSDIREQLNGASIEEYFAALLSEIPAEHDPLNQMLHIETNCFLAAHNLNYLDKMGMHHSVEIRVPYLDTELAKLSAVIPPALKMKGTTTKYLLRKVAERYLPEDIIRRQKTGFGAPIRTWMLENNSFRNGISDRVLQAADKWPEYFDKAAIAKLLEQTVHNKRDGAYTLFALCTVESWLRQFAISV